MSGTLETKTILDQIVAEKRREVAALKDQAGGRSGHPRRSAAPPRDLAAALADRARPGRSIIAEVKKASPSAGLLRPDFDPTAIARAYAAAGARAISVITDQPFFQGSIDSLRAVRAEVDLPLLQKDFIIDPIQLKQTHAAGADAALLIARILSDQLLDELYQEAGRLGLGALVEVHDRADLDRALRLRPAPRLIGVNNRDLANFTVSIDRTLELLPLIPATALTVSESGLDRPETLDRLEAAGVGAFLIGTALVKAPDPGAALKNLVDRKPAKT